MHFQTLNFPSLANLVAVIKPWCTLLGLSLTSTAWHFSNYSKVFLSLTPMTFRLFWVQLLFHSTGCINYFSSNPCEPQCQALALLLALYDDIEVMSSCDDFVHISVATAPHSHHSNLFFWSQPIRKQQQKQHTAYCWRVDCKANLCKATYFRETNMPPIWSIIHLK